MTHKKNKKIVNAWAFYDWANSVYSLVIGTAIFPIYYSVTTKGFASSEGTISFLNTNWNPVVLYDYTLAFSFLIVIIISPILSGISDVLGNKLKFMKFFCLLGSLSVIGLYFFKGEDTLWIGIVGTILASIGFWGSIVFYNAFLPEIAPKSEHNSISAKGYIFGYTGSLVLLLLNLIMINKPALFGIDDVALATRLTFVIVGVWWFGFAQISYRYLPSSGVKKKSKGRLLSKGWKELKWVALEIKKHSKLVVFLISFLFYSTGVQVIILIAGIFGSESLKLDTSKLILTILLVQIVAIIGAYLFSRLSKKIGNIPTLKYIVFIWMLVCFLAFNLNADDKYVELYFYGLGGLIGLVMGAIQSLSRATYSKMLPKTEDYTTFFSFYDVIEKIAIVIGMFIFGLLLAITGSIHWSILSLAIFFAISLLIMSSRKLNS